MKIFYKLLIGLWMLACETMPVAEGFVDRRGTASSSARTPVAVRSDDKSGATSSSTRTSSTSTTTPIELYRKGFAAQKVRLQQKIKKIQAPRGRRLSNKYPQLSSSNEQFSDVRKFTPQEWEFLMQAINSYFVALNAELDALMQREQIDVERPHNRAFYYQKFPAETTKVANSANITEFVNYLASLKGKGKNDTMIDFLRDNLTAISPETETIGSECIGLELLFGTNYSKLTDDEKAYVDQVGCPASGYFKGA